MYLAHGSDLFESFCNYQRRLIREFNALAKEFDFITVDARRSPELIQKKLREHIGTFLRNRSQTLKRPSVARALPPAEIAPVSSGNGREDEERAVSSSLVTLDSIKVQAAK